MRWPWQREHPDTQPSPEAAPANRPAAPSPMGWAFLPPLQRTVADPALVSRPHDFPGMLPAWRDPSFSSHELTHVVSAAAPSGVIDGDAAGQPTTRAEHDDLTLLLPPRPAVQRSAARATAAPADEPAPSLTRTSTASLPVLQLSSVDAPEAEAAPDTPTDDHPLLGAAAESSPAPPPATPDVPVQRRVGLGAPLPSMPPAVAPRGPAVQRSTETAVPHPSSPVPPRTPAAPPGPPTPSTASAPLPRTAPAAPPPTVVQRTVVDATTPDGATTPSTADAQVDVPDDAPSEPSVAVGDTDHAQPPVTPEPPTTPAPPTTPLATVPSIQRHEDHDHAPAPVAETEAGDDGEPDGAPTVSRAAEPVVETPTLAERAASVTVAEPAGRPDGLATDGPAPPSGPDAPLPLVQRSAADQTAEPTTRPLLGTEPTMLLPPTPVARTPVRATGSPPTPGPDLPTGGRSAVQRLLDVGRPQASRVEAAESSAASQDVVAPAGLDRLDHPVDVALTGLDRLDHPVDVAPEAVTGTQPTSGPRIQRTLDAPPQPLVQRALLGEWPQPPGSTGGSAAPLVQRAATGPSARGTAATAPLVQRAPDGVTAADPAPDRARPDLELVRPVPEPARPDLPLARSVDDGSRPAESTPTPALQATYEPAVPITVSRAMDALTAGATEVPIQRAEAAPDAPGLPEAARGGAGGASSAEDVEALAQKLLAPMMRRIRAEMLLDRERRGLRTDSW